MFWVFISCLYLGFLGDVSGFLFKEAIVYPGSYVTGETTLYTIQLHRYENNLYQPTPYQTPVLTISQFKVQNTDTVTVIFPSEFPEANLEDAILQSAKVDGNQIDNKSLTINGTTFTVSYLFQLLNGTQLEIQMVELKISGIKNPIPAIQVGTFSGTIGEDEAEPNSGKIQFIPAISQKCQITFSPKTVNTSSTMILEIEPTNPLPSNSQIKIQFPLSRRWSNNINTAMTIPIISGDMPCTSPLENPICIGNTSTFTINVTSFTSTEINSSFTLEIQGLTSPPTLEPSNQLFFTLYIGDYQLETCSDFPSGLQPKLLQGVTFSSSSSALTVNQQHAIIITIILSDYMNTEDEIQIVFPEEIAIRYGSINGPGPFNPSKSYVDGQKLHVELVSSFTRIFSPGDQFIIIFSNITAPPSTETITGIQVLVMRNGYAKMYKTGSITASPSIVSCLIDFSTKNVSAQTSYQFQLTLYDALSSAGYIQIYFPDTVIPNDILSCQLAGISVKNQATQCLYSKDSQNMVRISGIATGDLLTAQTLTINISNITNPPSTKPSKPFSIKTYYTSQPTSLVAQQFNIQGVTASKTTIDNTLATISSNNGVVYSGFVSFYFNFTNTFEIPKNSRIEVVIPNKVQVRVPLQNACLISQNDGIYVLISCSSSKDGDTYIIAFNNSGTLQAIAAKTQISLMIDSQAINPEDTGTVTGFNFTVYHSDGYPIQETVQDLSYRAPLLAEIPNITIISSSSTNSESPINLTFSFQQDPPLPASSQIVILFPPQIQFLPEMTLQDCPNLFDLNSNLDCFSSKKGDAYQVTVISENSRLDPGMSFGFIIGGVVNLPSFAPLTSSFTITTRSSDGKVSYATGTHLPDFINKIPSGLELNASFTGRIYGGPTSLNITLIPSQIASSIIVNISNSFTLSGLSCPINYCELVPGQQRQINVTGMTSLAEFQILITGLIAPKSDETDYTTVTSYDSEDYVISVAEFIRWEVGCDYPCRTCDQDILDFCLSCYKPIDGVYSEILFYDENQNTCSPECSLSTTYPNSTTFKCTPCDDNCYYCSQIATNCTSCNTNSSYSLLSITDFLGTCLSDCGIYQYPDYSDINQPVCVSCNEISSGCIKCEGENENNVTCLQCGNITTQSGIVVTFLSEGKCVLECSQRAIGNQNENICDPCDPICKTCSGTLDYCTSCQNLILLANTCVQCPLGTVESSGACVPCSSPCKYCYISPQNCTSCDKSGSFPYLVQNECLFECPDTYYQDQIYLECKLCIDVQDFHCRVCSTQTICTQGGCQDTYVFYKDKCYPQAPTGYYNDFGIARACNEACSSCIDQENCTSCKTLFLQYFTCQDTCDDGFYEKNNFCLPCSEECLRCQNFDFNCTACNSSQDSELFLTNYQCLQACPNYTYPNSDTYTCDECEPPCQMCSEKNICQTCEAGFYFCEGCEGTVTNCLQECPFGLFEQGRECIPCTGFCASCNLSVNDCTSCVDGAFLIAGTNKCIEDCSVIGLYNNQEINQCTQCDENCDTCSGLADNCTSCSGTLLLLNNTCLQICSEGFYPLNNECIPCKSECATCSSSSVCLTCNSNFYLFNRNCLSSCPSSHPVIVKTILTSICTKCSDTNCLVCDSLGRCSSCLYPFLLYANACVKQCPPDYYENGTVCEYDSPDETNNETNSSTGQTNETDETLNETLSTPNIFPVPVTVGGTFIGVACLMSKFQNGSTFLAGALYSLLSLLQWCSLAIVTYLYLVRTTAQNQFNIFEASIQIIVFIASVAFLYFLNFLSIFVQNGYLLCDNTFNKWQKKQFSNRCWYIVASIISLLFTHKFKNIIFSKLFGFEVFKARLDDIVKFRVFTAFSALSFLSSGGILFSIVSIVIKSTQETLTQQFMAYIDVIILTTICIILSILNSIKPSDFFEEKNEDGYTINKRINESQNLMNEILMPKTTYQFENNRGSSSKNLFETGRKLMYGSEIYSEEYEQAESRRQLFPQASVQQIVQQNLQYHNVSIQADPILSSHAKSDFFSNQELTFPIIQNRQVSVQHDFHLQKQDFSIQNQFDIVDHKDVSLQHDLNNQEKHNISIQNSLKILEQQDVSIQNNIYQEDVSIQYVPNKKDASFQFVPKEDGIGIQMSREENEISIQAIPNHNDISIQYSVKPFFENISKQFIDADSSSSQKLSQKSIQQTPVRDQRIIENQMDFDANQRFRHQEEARQQEAKQQKEKQIERMMNKFRKQRENQIVDRQPKIEGDTDKIGKLQKIYENQESRIDGSSLINQSQNQVIEIHKQAQTYPQKPQKQASIDKNYQNLSSRNNQGLNFVQRQRINSEKTQKQIINMLQQQQEFDADLSFNVTEDLQQKVPEIDRIKAKYEENDISIVDQDEDDEEIIEIQNIHTKTSSKSQSIENTQRNTLRDEVPVNDRLQNLLYASKSTNVQIKRLPNLLRYHPKEVKDSEISISEQMDEHDEIINGPINSQRIKQKNNFTEEDVDYESRAKMSLLNRKYKSNQLYEEKNRRFPSEKQSKIFNLQGLKKPIAKNEKAKSHESDFLDEMDYFQIPTRGLHQENQLSFQRTEQLTSVPKPKKFEYALENTEKFSKNSKKSLKKQPSKSKLSQKVIYRQILGSKPRYHDSHKETPENFKEKPDLQVRLARSSALSQQRNYMKNTYSSIDKNTNVSLGKNYQKRALGRKY